jgi:hypothetical protein
LNSLLLPVAQGGLLLMVRMRVMRGPAFDLPLTSAPKAPIIKSSKPLNQEQESPMLSSAKQTVQ